MATVREIMAEASNTSNRNGVLHGLVAEAHGAAWALGKQLRGSDVGLSVSDMDTPEYKKFEKLAFGLSAMSEKMRGAYVDLAEIVKGHGEP